MFSTLQTSMSVPAAHVKMVVNAMTESTSTRVLVDQDLQDTAVRQVCYYDSLLFLKFTCTL